MNTVLHQTLFDFAKEDVTDRVSDAISDLNLPPFDAKLAARELEAMGPQLEASLRALEDAGRVSREVLDLEFVI